MSTRGANQRRVIAAQRGDRQAQEELARAYLPLVYNVTSRPWAISRTSRMSSRTPCSR
jgi:hypothetical protein